MEKFEIGQKVRIVDNEEAHAYSLSTLGLIGAEFVVDSFPEPDEWGVPRDDYGNRLATFDSWYVPPRACELVEPTINHAEMVAALVKPGQDILDSLTAQDADLLHVTVGVAGEAGELLDAVKKAVIYRKPIDRINVIEELGDLEFYMERIRQVLGITREETIEANIAKLSVRYAGLKYSDQAAQTRADKE